MTVNKETGLKIASILNNDPNISNEDFYNTIFSKEECDMVGNACEIEETQEPKIETKTLQIVNELIKNNIHMQKELIKSNEELKRISLLIRKELE